ncbi:MAG: hypothetical protein SPL54_00305 [Lachnospiraceae bacterium]|nr:hypothetical protein [Lachnospiraceae bacterium]
MNDVKINITLDPLKDGLVMQDHGKKVPLERDLHYPIIGTDGQMRLLKPRESVDILCKLNGDLGSLSIGGGKYLVLYNEAKAFLVEGSKYFVGSFVVMKNEHQQLTPLTYEEICHVQDILENHMAVLRAGELTFSALEID